MLEYWNVGFGRLGKWENGVMTNNCIKCYYSIIPPYHYSIIPGWNKQNGWLGIPYYQQFVEFSTHVKNKAIAMPKKAKKSVLKLGQPMEWETY